MWPPLRATRGDSAVTAILQHIIANKIRAVFGPAAQLASLTPLAGDASSRRYFRAAVAQAGGPSSVIVMALPAASSLPLSSEELAVFKEPLKELPFLTLQRFLSGIGVRVPELYGHWETPGILLLEDLGDTALWDKVQGLPEEDIRAWYQRAVDELLVLQIRGTLARDEACIAFQQRFDYRLYMWEFEHFLEYGLEKLPGAAPGKSALDELRLVFAAIARRLDRETPCLNHRDYHSWNLMVHDGAVAVIDFQDALLAPPQYDLASLLNDRITDTVITPRLEEQLLQYYMAERAGRTKEALNPELFRDVYLLSAIQRDLKVVGRFWYLDIVKGKPGYKKFIPGTLRRLKRNLARLPQTEKVVSILADYYEEMR
jgi:aminoglycoside/choline kinase family phosphotransferase